MVSRSRNLLVVVAITLGCAPVDESTSSATSAAVVCRAVPPPVTCTRLGVSSSLDTYPSMVKGRRCVASSECVVRYVRKQVGGEVSIIGINASFLASFDRWRNSMCPWPQPTQPPAAPPLGEVSRTDDGATLGTIVVTCCSGNCQTSRAKL